jgi:hypothetical protein
MKLKLLYPLLLLTLVALPLKGELEIKGTKEEIRELVQPEPRTVTLQGAAAARIKPKGMLLTFRISASSKPLDQAQSELSESRKQIAAIPETIFTFSNTLVAPIQDVLISTTDKLTLTQEFKASVTTLEEAEKLLRELAPLKTVELIEAQSIYDNLDTVYEKVQQMAFKDLADNKEMYEESLNVALTLIDFIPFTTAELGGDFNEEEDIIELSPFMVSSRNRARNARPKVNLNDLAAEFTHQDLHASIKAIYTIGDK